MIPDEICFSSQVVKVLDLYFRTTLNWPRAWEILKKMQNIDLWNNQSLPSLPDWVRHKDRYTSSVNVMCCIRLTGLSGFMLKHKIELLVSDATAVFWSTNKNKQTFGNRNWPRHVRDTSHNGNVGLCGNVQDFNEEGSSHYTLYTDGHVKYQVLLHLPNRH